MTAGLLDRPAPLVEGCGECAAAGKLCTVHYRRWVNHGQPDSGVPAPRPGQRPGVSRLFWEWAAEYHAPGTDPAVCKAYGVTRRTLNRWRAKQIRLVAAGLIDPPPGPPTARASGLKSSDSGYGTYGANLAAGYEPGASRVQLPKGTGEGTCRR